jgi:hypothetical protein
MSLLEDKKAMLDRLAKQKAMYQKNIFKIPKISTKQEVPKTFIPNIKSIEKKTNEEDKMRKFLSDVLEIQEDDFIMSNDDEDLSIFSYNNKIIDNGYKLYIQTRLIDVISEDEDIDRSDAVINVIKEWKNESFLTKLIWVIKAYANKEWSREVTKHRSKDMEKLESELVKLNKERAKDLKKVEKMGLKKQLSSELESIDDRIKYLQDEISKLNKKTDQPQNVGWGARKFADDIELYIKNDSVLKTFIQQYLNSNKTYDVFVKHWLASSQGGIYSELIEDEEIKENENDEISNRLPISEKEKELIDDLRERLTGYEEGFLKLEKKVKIREQLLNELSHKGLVKLAVPIMERKSNEELIKYMIDLEYEKIKRDKYNMLNVDSALEGSQSNEGIQEFNKFAIQIDKEKKEKAEELSNLSRQDLLMMATNQKSSSALVKMIVEEEFSKSRKKLQQKMSKLSIEIHNLSLGRYVGIPEKVKKLPYKERRYRELLIVYIRKLELQSWSYTKLALHSSNIKAKKARNKDDKVELIDNILKVEFPNVVQSELKKITRNQMLNVLNTLSDDQLYVLAKENNISNIGNRSRTNIIDTILSLEYKTVKHSARQAITGRNVSNWSREARKIELDDLIYKNLIEIAFTYGINLNENTNQADMITKILNYEERIAKLIPIEDAEKERLIEKIIKITGEPFSAYSLWSMEELDKKIREVADQDYEYMKELEKEDLIKKLSDIVDIRSEKYVNVKSWSVKKLIKTLEKLGKVDWENYQTSLESYSFVKCMREYKLFKWIDGKVTGIWLESPGTKNVFDVYSDYVFLDVFIEENGKKWYQANKKYFALHCNKYKGYIKQNGDILTCYTNEGKPIYFKVGYTVTGSTKGSSGGTLKGKTRVVKQMVAEIRYDEDHKPVKTMIEKNVKRTFIIQDESLFRKEKQETKSSNQSDVEKANELLNSYVTEKSKQLVSQSISKALKEIAPLKNDYGIINVNTKRIDSNTPYMQVLMDNLVTNAEQTNRDLFTKAADILAYLTIPEAKTFRHNIEMEYYLPDILARLSPIEKFPEAFEQVIANNKLLSKKCVMEGDEMKCTFQKNDEVSDKYINHTTSIINNKIMKIVNYLALKSVQNPIHKNLTIYENSYFTIKTHKRISACANKDRVVNAKPEEIVYYKEGDKIYCFTVDELYNQFINDDFTNPETGVQFNIKFIKRFNELYNKKLVEDGFLTTQFQEKYRFDMKELISDKQTEDSVKSIPSIATNLWDIIAIDIEELENQLSNQESEEDDDREVERRDDEVEKGTRETREISKQDACEYCKKHLLDDSIKTIIRHGTENRIIKFCSFSCFENKNDWKVKKKKDKKQIEVEAIEVEAPVKKKKKSKKVEEPVKKKKKSKKVEEPVKKKKKSKKVEESVKKKKKSKKTDEKKKSKK